jgi:hypothetical protein
MSSVGIRFAGLRKFGERHRREVEGRCAFSLPVAA